MPQQPTTFISHLWNFSPVNSSFAPQMSNNSPINPNFAQFGSTYQIKCIPRILTISTLSNDISTTRTTCATTISTNATLLTQNQLQQVQTPREPEGFNEYELNSQRRRKGK